MAAGRAGLGGLDWVGLGGLGCAGLLCDVLRRSLFRSLLAFYSFSNDPSALFRRPSSSYATVTHATPLVLPHLPPATSSIPYHITYSTAAQHQTAASSTKHQHRAAKQHRSRQQQHSSQQQQAAAPQQQQRSSSRAAAARRFVRSTQNNKINVMWYV